MGAKTAGPQTQRNTNIHHKPQHPLNFLVKLKKKVKGLTGTAGVVSLRNVVAL
ncbi:MAG: hypothetical protein FWD46_08905 [Cystobacterineae bacterium]|nr:hypothetical protein [Cystobacterineae bacterium]